MARDKEKALESSRRYRRRKKIERFGEDMADIDLRGRHSNHARGEGHHRFNSGRMISSHGYAIVKVGPGQPHAWQSRGGQWFGYEHHVVLVAELGRPLFPDEVAHHINEDKTDNRPENLTVLKREEHSRQHAQDPNVRGPDGRFLPEIDR